MLFAASVTLGSTISHSHLCQSHIQSRSCPSVSEVRVWPCSPRRQRSEILSTNSSTPSLSALSAGNSKPRAEQSTKRGLLTLSLANSYSVYIAILIFYFINIFFTFPETKKLSAEQASVVFDMTKGARMRSSPGARTDEREIESLEYAEKNDKAEVEEIEKKG